MYMCANVHAMCVNVHILACCFNYCSGDLTVVRERLTAKDEEIAKTKGTVYNSAVQTAYMIYMYNARNVAIRDTYKLIASQCMYVYVRKGE